jgi:hypothetical protein
MRKTRFKPLVSKLLKIVGSIAQKCLQARLAIVALSVVLVGELSMSRAANIVTFREGVNGYAGTHDTFLSVEDQTTDYGSADTLQNDGESVDADGVASEAAQTLLRFENLFGSGTNQVPSKAKILFASLTLTITNEGDDPGMHRMLVPWQESSTWTSMVGGILPDDVEAALTEDQTFDAGNTGKVIIPLALSTIQAWADGTKTNLGWAFYFTGTGGTDFSSSEDTNLDERPLLTIVWGTVDEPFITSITPGDGATDVPVDSNIALTISDGATQLNPASVRLSVNGQNVTPVLDKPADTIVTTITYDPPASLPQNSLVTVRVIYSDNANPVHTSTNNFSFKTRANTATLVKIDDVQIWKYDRSGTDLGTAWKEKAFNDSAWPEGMALIGQEGTTIEPLRTPIERFNDNGDYVQTFYFRTHFNYAGPLGGDLFLRHMIDDGAVFYLNGVEIHRFGIGAGVAFDYLTSFSGHEHAYEGPFTIPGSALVAGDNVFAAEVHQSGTGSSDIVFGAELLVSTTPPPPPPTNQVTTTLIAIDDKQMWRFENTGKDLGTAWKDKTFNDSSWPQGAALLALEGTTPEPVRTPLVRQDPAGAGIITDYFRTHFTYNGDVAGAKLSLRHVVDDGFVLYLNGTEVYRFGVAAGQTFSTTASDHENRYEGPFDIPATALVAGDNVLAAEVHQGSATSSDVVFGVELKAITTGAPPTASKFTLATRTGTNLNLEWSGTGILQSASAVTGPWTDVANARSPFSEAIAGTAKFYRFKP